VVLQTNKKSYPTCKRFAREQTRKYFLEKTGQDFLSLEKTQEKISWNNKVFIPKNKKEQLP
jgi:hypothetical protein